MTRENSIKVLSILKAAYPNAYKDFTTKQAEDTINLYCMMFNDNDVDLILLSVKELINNFKFPPMIADIKDQMYKLSKINNSKTAIEAWGDAYKLICRGTTVSQEEFDNLEPKLKKFFGGLSQLKDYATSTNVNIDVVRSNFLKAYDVLEQREKQEAIMLLETKTKLEQLSQKFTKQIKG